MTTPYEATAIPEPPAMTTTHTTRRPDGWWIVDTPDGIDECGPYTTKAEAEEDLRGIRRFLKYEDKPGYVTVCRQKTRVKVKVKPEREPEPEPETSVQLLLGAMFAP